VILSRRRNRDFSSLPSKSPGAVGNLNWINRLHRDAALELSPLVALATGILIDPQSPDRFQSSLLSSQH
jgi:hypothetical protein